MADDEVLAGRGGQGNTTVEPAFPALEQFHLGVHPPLAAPHRLVAETEASQRAVVRTIRRADTLSAICRRLGAASADLLDRSQSQQLPFQLEGLERLLAQVGEPVQFLRQQRGVLGVHGGQETLHVASSYRGLPGGEQRLQPLLRAGQASAPALLPGNVEGLRRDGQHLLESSLRRQPAAERCRQQGGGVGAVLIQQMSGHGPGLGPPAVELCG